MNRTIRSILKSLLSGQGFELLTNFEKRFRNDRNADFHTITRNIYHYLQLSRVPYWSVCLYTYKYMSSLSRLKKKQQPTTKRRKSPHFFFHYFHRNLKINSIGSVFLWFEWCRYAHINIRILPISQPLFSLINSTFSPHRLEFILMRKLYLSIIIISIVDLRSRWKYDSFSWGSRKIPTYFSLIPQWNAEVKKKKKTLII